ncbi:MAG: zf-HC2 domain-containing protein [Acidobacteria bacterium]|nr:zf-HC2 domain-containing protein [Acidobacteriota bacterium]
MLCNTVSKRLSEFFDGVLDDEMSVQVSQHLIQCESCQKELDALSNLHGKLNSLTRIPAPEYLHHLVQTRLLEKKNNTWIRQIKDALALRWSRIRTTGGQFYWTRALGITMSAFFLFVISSSIDPFYAGGVSQAAERTAINKEDSKRVRNEFSRNLGVFPIEMARYERQYGAALHDEYLIEFGKNDTSESDEDALTVVTEIDTIGVATIQNVIESPNDRDLLNNFRDMISLARFRPAVRGGQAVSSQMVLKYLKTTVYE